MRAPQPGEQRSKQQHGPAQPADEPAIGRVRAQPRRADPKGGAANAVNLRDRESGVEGKRVKGRVKLGVGGLHRKK
jgi:hypothetical protein